MSFLSGVGKLRAALAGLMGSAKRATKSFGALHDAIDREPFAIFEDPRPRGTSPTRQSWSRIPKSKRRAMRKRSRRARQRNR